MRGGSWRLASLPAASNLGRGVDWQDGWLGRSHGRDSVCVCVCVCVCVRVSLLSHTLSAARFLGPPHLGRCLQGAALLGALLGARVGGGSPSQAQAPPASLPLSPQALVFAKEGRASPGVWLQSRIITAGRAGAVSARAGARRLVDWRARSRGVRPSSDAACLPVSPLLRTPRPGERCRGLGPASGAFSINTNPILS